MRSGLFITVTCPLQQTGWEASHPGPPFRELWTSQEDRAGLLIFLGLSFLCGLMEKVQARGPTDLDLEFGSAVHQCEMRDECPCFSKLNALLQNGPKWHIIRDSK